MNKEALIIFESERLRFRPLQSADASFLYELNNDPDVIRHTGDPPFKSVQAASRFLNNYADYRIHGYGRWAVELKSNNQFIGWCGLKLHEDDFTDLGFRFFKKEWNKGYATEATRACLTYGFESLGLAEIVGRSARENVASIRVLEKCGFTFWKEDVCDGIPNARWYRIFRPDNSLLHP